MTERADPPAVGPVISVVICTYNRADQLPRAIQSVLQQGAPARHYELIVVDNASTDHTREVTRQFEVDGIVRYEFERTPGLCHARNTGWRRARGQYVAYLDDDAIASSDWLASIEEAFSLMPDVGIVGGRVDPIWEGSRPTWLSNEIALSLTILDWSDQPVAIDDVRRWWLVGANMAVRRSVLAEVGGFHPGLDRVGDRLLSGGDVFLAKQIIGRRYVCLYYPRMAVRHAVPRARLEKRWFIRRYYAQGLSDAAMRLIEDAPSWPERMRLALLMIGRLLGSPRRLLSLVLPCDDPGRFTEKCFCLISVGHVAGLLGALKK